MYDFKKIEAKWQKYWEDNKTYKFNKDNIDKKLYCLEMFSYPSGANLHLGHWYNFGVTDTWARLKRMQGFEVFHPMGFDAFGLPAENYAIKTGVHPKDSITKNTDTMEKQLKAIGATYDWDYKIITSTPDYYKWTQWMFLKLYEKGLAYKKEAPVNFCPSCQTVLANEQVVSGNCERCNTQVERKKLSQWFFKITEYADELLNGLEDIDWPEKTKTLQKNWIGKSKGAMVKFTVVDKNANFEVFTTRVDTLYGCTYCVLAPENELVEKITTKDNLDQVHKYLKEASKTSEIDRMSTVKEKTGVFTGSYALNPVNGKKIPIWIADYVISSYGTGAVMAVPAHDERDYEFAKKYDLEIIPVIERITGTANENESFKKSIVALVFDPKTNKYLTLDWKDKGGTLLIGGTIHDEEDIVVCATREITEKTGYKNLKYISSSFPINHHYYAFNKNKYFSIEATGVYFELINEEITDNNLDEDEKDCFNIKWLSKEEVETEIKDELHITIFENLINPTAYTENGLMCNSSEMDGLDNEIAAVKIVDKLNKINSGKFITNYRLRDWLVSRQRYWGAPIPIIYCDKCGTVPVPEKDLPVELPYDVEFKPDGKSPLSKSEAFINTKCPKCGGPAKREADTLDTFVCSSWYFLRYPDVNNDQEPFNKELINKMLPVDKYVGGIEHACMHLLYARFFTKALRDMGYLNFDEPFKSLVHQGTILGSDGEKMSKSKGNTISPDEYIEKYGSDVLRTYLMFGFNYVDGGPWKDDGIKSTAKFYERICRVVEYFKDNYNEENFSDIDLVMNKTIKEVIKDTEKFQFNTAISRLMEYLNILTKYMTSKKKINKEYIINLVLLIAPFAPHLSEELWTMLGYKESIFKESYPQADVSKIKEDTYEMVVQVNGKVRARKTVKIDINEEEMKQEALSDDNVQVHLQDKKIVKIISVPQKLINIVVK